MDILIVGNVTKDVYLNLDTQTEAFETDSNNIKWLDLKFNASKHSFFNRSSNFGGAAVSLEVLQKMRLSAAISDSNLNFSDEDAINKISPSLYRYILIADENVTYFAPEKTPATVFAPPTQPISHLLIDRSANLDQSTAEQINAFLNTSPDTKLILYVKDASNRAVASLVSRADVIFFEKNRGISEKTYAPELTNLPPEKTIFISETAITYQNLTEPISVNRVDMLTHLSAYSIVAATILGGFILNFSVEDSLKLARAGVENTKINSVLSLDELQEIAGTYNSSNELELIAANLVLYPKGILAADESGGSINKKFAQQNIEDTYENRRDYRNLFFTTADLEKYINGVILFDETAHQTADNGQNFVDFLTSRRIIPGIKVDQGLAPLNDTTETYTKGLDGLLDRLKEYYQMGLRFAKWRAAFEIHLSDSGEILTPTKTAITENCRILAEYASTCQSAGLVPIVEPEVVYDGDYTLEHCAQVSAQILDTLFSELKAKNVNLKACILKTNMILAGKQQSSQTGSEIVGQATAEVLKQHVPAELAGVVFLSGGQTPEQATNNLAEIIKNGPFPWPVTFSFARALQDPALFAWQGNNQNADAAKKAFLERLIANSKALEI